MIIKLYLNIFLIALTIVSFGRLNLLTASGPIVKEVNACWQPRPTLTPIPTQTPTPTPTPTLVPSLTPTPTNSPSNNSSNTNSDPGVKPYSCESSKPGTPNLNVIRLTDDKVRLSWSVTNPVTRYAISYGLVEKSYEYGVNDTGNVTAYEIGGLTAGQNYCFAVRGINDCMPGDLSNQICTNNSTGTGGLVLGASTMADTGTRDELVRILFIMGSICICFGIRKNSLDLV